MTLKNHIHQVLYHMGQSISRDSDVIKSNIHKTATIRFYLSICRQYQTCISTGQRSTGTGDLLVPVPVPVPIPVLHRVTGSGSGTGSG